MKNTYLITAIVAVIVGVGSFFGGIKYQQSKASVFSRQMPGGRGRFDRRVDGNGPNVGLNAVRGAILSVDENGITIKLADESSKIVILADSTVINKTEKGSKEDLNEGTEVAVFGSANDDGSVTAQNIQIGTGMFTRP
jgi:hypothetical protein